MRLALTGAEPFMSSLALQPGQRVALGPRIADDAAAFGARKSFADARHGEADESAVKERSTKGEREKSAGRG